MVLLNLICHHERLSTVNRKPEKLYDKTGKGYNSTRQADPYLTEALVHHLQPQENKLYLDLGCGTGNYAIALTQKGYNFTGVDPSEKMLKEAIRKKPEMTWLPGFAEEIPALAEAFDGAIATLTIHHWKDVARGFRELHRVLKPGSRIVIFSSTPAQMQHYWLCHYFPEMLRVSMEQMPGYEATTGSLRAAGFSITSEETYEVKDNLKDLFLYSGKNKPEMYFEENVRKGISSFSALAHREEVEQGLLQLQADISSNQFNRVKAEFAHQGGDYLFLVAEKGTSKNYESLR
jgi:ubiquinone/menaquinone biosynthesis C-methylase UbiE